MAVAAIAPIIGTAVLHRELTYSEVYHMTLSAFLGRENLRLQTELLAQEKVFELQTKLLSLREIINSPTLRKE